MADEEKEEKKNEMVTAQEETETKKIEGIKVPGEGDAIDPEKIDSYIEALKIMNAEKPKKPKRALWWVISFFIMIAVAIGAYVLTK